MSFIHSGETVSQIFQYLCEKTTEYCGHGIMILKDDCHCGRKIRETGNLDHYDPIRSFCVDLLPPNGIAMDCGAMYGSNIIAWQKKLNYQGTIIAIEPGRIAYECMKKNCDEPFFRKVFFNMALCENAEGYLRHKITDDHGSSLVTDWDHTGENVQCTSIDKISSYLCLHRLDLIRIKCQGWEYRILKGAKETLSNLFPIIVMEINHSQLALHENNWNQIKDLLNHEGYSWEILEPGLTEESEQFNIVCKPNFPEERLKLILTGLMPNE